MTPLAILRERDVGKAYTREGRFVRNVPKIVWLPRIVQLDDVGKEVFKDENGNVEIGKMKTVKPKQRTKVCALCGIEKSVDGFRAKPIKKPERTRIYFTYTPWCLACGARKYRLWRESQKKEKQEKQQAPISWREFGGLPIGAGNGSTT